MFIWNNRYNVDCKIILHEVTKRHGQHGNENKLLNALCAAVSRPGKNLDFTVDTKEFLQVLKHAHPIAEPIPDNHKDIKPFMKSTRNI